MFEPILVQVSNKFRDTKALKLFTKIKNASTLKKWLKNNDWSGISCVGRT